MADLINKNFIWNKLAEQDEAAKWQEKYMIRMDLSPKDFKKQFLQP